MQKPVKETDKKTLPPDAKQSDVGFTQDIRLFPAGNLAVDLHPGGNSVVHGSVAPIFPGHGQIINCNHFVGSLASPFELVRSFNCLK
jgi:hypothetical protein